MSDDPYRTLGLDRGASLEEVKRAYRRLVKANHPDAAGEAALPRFLAIQEAYDRIVGPDGGPGRQAGRPGARRPWEADAERAGATYRAYGGRPRPRPGARPGPRTRPAADTSGSTRSRPQTDPGERRRKRATLGSTSYDDVDPDAFTPDWGGASWYGTTSGTYWTINPKEYADPRKHGPEYQARARRGGRVQPNDPTIDAPTTGAGPADAPIDPGLDDEGTSTGAPPAPPPTHTTASWWDATTGEPPPTAPGRTGATARRAPDGPPRTPPPPPVGEPAPATGPTSGLLLDAFRDWLEDAHPGGVSRIGRAVIGWAPIALGAGWLAGELSGCGRFAATCPPTVAPVTWVTQLALLVLLVLAPPLARIGAIGTVAILGTVFPASVLLFATADPAGVEWGRPILGGLIVVAWVVGLGFGVVREVRRGTRPVS